MMETLINLHLRDDLFMSQLGPKKSKYDKILLMYSGGLEYIRLPYI